VRAAVYHGRRDVRIEAVEPPETLGDDAVLLEVSRASICGTDLGEYLHGPRMVPLHQRHPASRHVGPLILGHELTGRVLAAGSDVTQVSVGDRVVPGAGNWCGECSRCREGRVNLCEQYFVYGLHAHGGLAERVVLPAKMCHRLPSPCTDDGAALAQPLAIALHAIRRSGARLGESLAVVGVGGIGSFLTAAASTLGPMPLIAIDLDPGRLEHAMRVGADVLLQPGQDDVTAAVRRVTGGEGADVVIEASGSPGGLEVALGAVRRGGRLHLVGLPARPSTIDLHESIVHEVDFSSSNGHVCTTDIPEALDLLAAADLGAQVTDRVIELDQLVTGGLEPMSRGEVHGKVVVAIG
jgi:(R,R)-butanediol dehydrogenase / meso-butanediol dehydrogenase / diacetyl reductase